MIPKMWAYGATLLAVSAIATWGYSTVHANGVAACERKQQVAAATSAAEDHKNYVAAIAWGSQMSTKLAAKQQELKRLKNRHEDAARTIPGTCPDGLRVLHDAAAAGLDIPEPTGQADGTSSTVAASEIGSTIAINYAACQENAERLGAWIEWCQGIKGCAP